jgi:hypothetical protein
MSRWALALAACALVAAALPSPGLYAALGLGIAAIGVGWNGYARRDALGPARLAAAAAITLGAIGVVLGAVRVILVLAALSHIDSMLG